MLTLGANATAAGNLDISPAYNGGTLIPFGPATFGLRAAANTRNTYYITGVVTGLAPGTYTFGIAERVTNAADIPNWNNNEYGHVSVVVMQ